MSTSPGSTHRVWPQPGVCPATAAALHGIQAVPRCTASARRPERAPSEGGVAGTCVTQPILSAEWLVNSPGPVASVWLKPSIRFSPCCCCFCWPRRAPLPRARAIARRRPRGPDASHQLRRRGKSPRHCAACLTQPPLSCRCPFRAGRSAFLHLLWLQCVLRSASRTIEGRASKCTRLQVISRNTQWRPRQEAEPPPQEMAGRTANRIQRGQHTIGLGTRLQKGGRGGNG